jgi:hypothetical protein
LRGGGGGWDVVGPAPAPEPWLLEHGAKRDAFSPLAASLLPAPSPTPHPPHPTRSTIVYKGMLRSVVVGEFYEDLADPAYETAFAIYHRRFSTNTTPKWPLAQPMRVLGHNGAGGGAGGGGWGLGGCELARGGGPAAGRPPLRPCRASPRPAPLRASTHLPPQARSTPCRATSTGWRPASRS